MFTYARCGIAFQIMRVYAISGRRWPFALIVGALSIYPYFFEIVRLYVTRSMSAKLAHVSRVQFDWTRSIYLSNGPPLQGCETYILVSEALYKKYVVYFTSSILFSKLTFTRRCRCQIVRCPCIVDRLNLSEHRGTCQSHCSRRGYSCSDYLSHVRDD